MKKLVSIVLALVCILSLVGCNLSENTCSEDENTYRVDVTGSKSSLMNTIKSRYPAGTVVEIKAYPVTDVSLRVFVNGEEIPMSHYDSDYWGFEFVMPEENVTIHLTYDQFYGKDEYTFKDLYPLYFLTSNVDKVSIRTTNFSEKYSLIETRYSIKQKDIDNFKAIVALMVQWVRRYLPMQGVQD